jgi:RNA polymerase sigma-70 factor (ECF subfamily)
MAHPSGVAIRLHDMTSSDDFTALLSAMRPRLHRYCARMAGSALDGEDIVQDALAKAALHYDAAAVREAEAWLYRIAHNAALDFLRRRTLERSLFVDEPPDDALAAGAEDPHAAAATASAALATFMHLPVAQRSAVILADVLGHALTEIAQLLGTTVPAVKAALHRGRARLRELGPSLHDAPALAPQEQALARLYAQRFNARDFDGLRALLAEEVRLQLAGRGEMNGKAEVSNYFGNYARIDGWRAEPGVVEGRGGLWVYEGDAAQPAYGVVLDWDAAGRLRTIRDFRYARYVTEPLVAGLS